MGLVWGLSDSVGVQQGLRLDVGVWDSGLACWELSLARIGDLVGVGPNAALSGSAWNAARTLFLDRILPVVATGRDVCSWLLFHLDSYAVFEGPLVEKASFLDEAALRATVDGLNAQIGALASPPTGRSGSTPRVDNSGAIAQLQAQVVEIEDVVGRLVLFNEQVSGIFNSEISLSQTLSDAVGSIGAGTLSASGVYSPPGGVRGGGGESWLLGLADYAATHPRNPQLVFGDLPGQYGGDQGFFVHNWDSMSQSDKQQIIDIVRKYYPDMSDGDIARFRFGMNATGCVYVADVNSILQHFANNPAGFAAKFGFPLYNPDGTVNFNALFTEFWCYAQLRSGRDPLTDPRTLSVAPAVDDWPSFLATKGFVVTETYLRPSSFDDYGSMSKQGVVEIGLTDCDLFNPDGSFAQHVGGAHCMAVTGAGVDTSGRRYFTVSSWGKRYVVYPDDYDPGNMDMGVYVYGNA